MMILRMHMSDVIKMKLLTIFRIVLIIHIFKDNFGTNLVLCRNYVLQYKSNTLTNGQSEEEITTLGQSTERQYQI